MAANTRIYAIFASGQHAEHVRSVAAEVSTDVPTGTEITAGHEHFPALMEAITRCQATVGGSFAFVAALLADSGDVIATAATVGAYCQRLIDDSQ